MESTHVRITCKEVIHQIVLLLRTIKNRPVCHHWKKIDIYGVHELLASKRPWQHGAHPRIRSTGIQTRSGRLRTRCTNKTGNYGLAYGRAREMSPNTSRCARTYVTTTTTWKERMNACEHGSTPSTKTTSVLRAYASCCWQLRWSSFDCIPSHQT